MWFFSSPRKMPLECGGSGGRIQGHMPLITPNLPKLNVHAFPVSPSYQGQLIFLQKMLHIPPENQDLVIYPILPTLLQLRVYFPLGRHPSPHRPPRFLLSALNHLLCYAELILTIYVKNTTSHHAHKGQALHPLPLFGSVLEHKHSIRAVSF